MVLPFELAKEETRKNKEWWRRQHFPPGRDNRAFRTVKRPLLYYLIVLPSSRMEALCLLGRKAPCWMLVRKKSSFLGTRRLSGTFLSGRLESPCSQTRQQVRAAAGLAWPGSLAGAHSGFRSRSVPSEKFAPRHFSDFNVPPSAEFVARPVGVCSLLKLPVQTSAEGLDAAFVGVPLDTGTSNRPGAR